MATRMSEQVSKAKNTTTLSYKRPKVSELLTRLERFGWLARPGRLNTPTHKYMRTAVVCDAGWLTRRPDPDNTSRRFDSIRFRLE